MNTVAHALLKPDVVGDILTNIENDFRQRKFDGSTDAGRRDVSMAEFRIDVLTGLMTQLLDDHVANHPDDHEIAAQSRQQIAYRMGTLRAFVGRHLRNDDCSDSIRPLGTACLRAALALMQDYVDRLPTLVSMSVAEIDQLVGELLHADTTDWREFAAEAAALHHCAVFELMRLRAKKTASAEVDIPQIRQRLRADIDARDALIEHGLSCINAMNIVAAIRRRDIPHVSIAH